MHRPRRRTNQSSLSLRSFVISAGPFSFQSSVVTQWTQHRQCVPFTSTAHWHCLSIVLSSMPMRCICRTVLPFLAHRFPQICPHSHPRPFLFLCVSERLWSWRLVAVVVAARPVHSTILLAIISFAVSAMHSSHPPSIAPLHSVFTI